MLFPLRLTADLLITETYRALRGSNGRPLISIVLPDSQSAISSQEPRSCSPPSKVFDLERVVSISRWRSPIVWIGGPEPLEHPDTPRVANALASTRHVFLETSGALLQARVHELQPSSRLYVVIRFDRMGESSSAGMEALRFARICGFLTCARLVVDPCTEAGAARQFRAQISELDVDGLLISPTDLSQPIAGAVSRLRRQLLARPWILVSRELDEALLPPAERVGPMRGDPRVLAESQPDNLSEEAQAG